MEQFYLRTKFIAGHKQTTYVVCGFSLGHITYT